MFEPVPVVTKLNELCHDKTNIMGLRTSWIRTSLRSLIRMHAVLLPTLLQVAKLIVNSMDPDQAVRMRSLVWIHAGPKPIILVLS
jgi:hypothetical protein